MAVLPGKSSVPPPFAAIGTPHEVAIERVGNYLLSDFFTKKKKKKSGATEIPDLSQLFDIIKGTGKIAVR